MGDEANDILSMLGLNEAESKQKYFICKHNVIYERKWSDLTKDSRSQRNQLDLSSFTGHCQYSKLLEETIMHRLVVDTMACQRAYRWIVN